MSLFVKVKPSDPKDFKIIKQKLMELPCKTHFVIQKGIEEEFVVVDCFDPDEVNPQETICHKLCELTCDTEVTVWTPEANEVVLYKNIKCKFKVCGLQYSIVEIDGEKISVPNSQIKPLIN